MFAIRSLLALPFSSTGHWIAGAACAPTLVGGDSFSAINLTAQRWKRNQKWRKRKPIGAPRSRKMKYYVKQPTPIVPDELSELFWRNAHYKTECNALQAHFKKLHLELNPTSQTSTVTATPTQIIDQDFERRLAENEQQNEKVAIAREARRAQELALREHIRLEDYTEFEDRQAEQLEKYEEIVRKKKEVVARMITPDNLDERLNRAFDNPVDYQFGIMLGGKRVYGRPDPLNHINMAYTGKNDRETKEVELSPEITAETAAADERIANR